VITLFDVYQYMLIGVNALPHLKHIYCNWVLYLPFVFKYNFLNLLILFVRRCNMHLIKEFRRHCSLYVIIKAFPVKLCTVTPLQNASFTVPWLGMSGMGTLCKTPLALLEQARSCCSPSSLHSPGHTQLYRSANSFHIFLRVLALCLAQDRAGGVPQRQIKGR